MTRQSDPSQTSRTCDVVLIYPPITKRERYSSSIGSAGGSQPPLGILSLAAWVREQGLEPVVIDGEASGRTSADIAQQVASLQPALAGISSSTVALGRAIEVGQAIRQAAANIPIAVGGPHASALPESILDQDCFDYAIGGEGEQTLMELLEVCLGRRDPAEVKGLAFRRDGRIVVNEPRPRMDDLDALPFPAYDLLEDLKPYTPPPCNYRTLPVLSIVSSRGCPNACTFCDRSTFGRMLRQRSAASIAAEIRRLRRDFCVGEIAFLDDTFTLNPQRIYDLFERLDAENIKIWWTCMSRVDTVDYDLLKFMADHGCWHISFGIESGSEEILKRIKKNIDLDKAHRVIGWCRELGIHTKGFFMLGHPGETEQTIEQTIDLALKLPLSDIVATLNTPLPGSEQYVQASADGAFQDGDWSRFNCWNTVFVPEGLSADYLNKMHRRLYRKFYFRPSIVGRYFRQTFSAGGLRRAWGIIKALPFLFLKQRSPAGEA